jgi:23S rRNA pseudouridine2457 synthase
MNEHRYFLIHKPIDMVSQFVSSHAVNLLGSLSFDFPEGTHAIGRLDQASEGLLLLTTNKKVTKLLFQGAVPHKRTYLVQVKNKVSLQTVQQLAKGILISAPSGEKYLTTPCEVQIVQEPRNIAAPPKPLHKNVQFTWLLISLTEGKYHQVRKMVAAVQHRCIRLIRVSIESLELNDMQPGEVKEIAEIDFFEKLNLNAG